MSRARSLALALTGTLVLGLGVIAVTRTLALELLEPPRPTPPPARTTGPGDTDGLRERVDALLEPARLAETWTEQRGSGSLRRSRYVLPPGVDAEQLAERLRAGLEADDQAFGAPVRVYLGEGSGPDLTVRVRLGQELRHRLELQPTLTLAQQPIPPARDRPLIALLVEGLGADGAELASFVNHPLPLTLGVTPFQPFSMRAGRDGLRAHKEILILLDPAAPTALTVDAVPWASGLAVFTAPEVQLPLDQLRDRGWILVDPDHLLSPASRRAAADAGVPVQEIALRVGEELEGVTARVEHLALEELGVVVVVDADSAALPGLIDWMSANRQRYKPALVSEVVDRRRNRATPEPPPPAKRPQGAG